MKQTKHVDEAIGRFDLEDAKIFGTPMDVNTLNNGNSASLQDPRLYRSLVGVLNYIQNGTRPDISFTVGFLSRNMKNPTYADLAKAKRCLKYLKGTKELGLSFETWRLTELKLELYVDSSWGNGPDRKSICGYVILVNHSVIHYKSKTQSIVCLSSTEAEFLALSLGLKDLLWIRNILLELRYVIQEIVCYVDNQGALKLVKGESGMGKTRHMDIKLQFVKQEVKNKGIKMQYITGDSNPADLFTKALSRPTFEKHRNELVYQ